KFLADTGQGCNNPKFGGGPVRGAGPKAPPAANLTPAGNLKNWTEPQFMAALRTGKTPDGKQIDPKHMPWRSFAMMTDDELKAIFLFLKSLPPAP
ncbi:MAG: cytochrome C, partial [Anaerolineae bacterium]|nr:cytochrome C [Anaerolineae bacterium]